MSDTVKKITAVVEVKMGDSVKKLESMFGASKDVASGSKEMASGMSAASVAAGVLTGNLATDVIKAFGEAVGSATAAIINFGTQTQKTISGFAAMKNYVGDATEAYREFNDVGRNTNYDLNAVQEMGAQLLNMGYSAQNAASLIQLCADTAAGLNKGQAEAQMLVDTLSRIHATGEMSSRQLITLQMAGMDLDKAFKSVNMSAEEAMKAMDDGSLDAQTAIKALTDYMHEFDGSMAESKNNITDMWGDVTGNVQTFMGEIGASIFDAFNQSGIIQELIGFTQDLVDMVRSDGTGAFTDLKDVASEVLNFIGGLLGFVLDTIKLIIVILHDAYAAFKDFGVQVVDAVRPAVDIILTLYDAVKSVLSAVGKGFGSEVGRSWSKTFGPDPDDADSYAIAGGKPNNFRTRSSGSGGSRSGGGGGAKTISEEERAIDALIKKYTDADKARRNSAKTEMEMARINLSMMVGEAKATEEKRVKLDALQKAHEDMMIGYDNELKAAAKIADGATRDRVIAEIKRQKDAEEDLYNMKVKAVEFESSYKANQKETASLLDSVFGTQDEFERKIKETQDGIARIFQTVDTLKSGGQASFEEGDMDFISRLLKMTPEALQEELDAKGQSLETFIEKNKEMLAGAAKASVESDKTAKAWADNTVKYCTMVGDAMADAMMDFITGAKTGKEALQDFVKNMLKNAATLLARWLMLFAIFSIVGEPRLAARNASAAVFGAGEVNLKTDGKAAGGLITGPGSGTSDSIPTMLSNGEYVIRAAAVKRIGVPTLNAINARGAIGYANGGLVGRTSGGTVGAMPMGNTVNMSLYAMDPVSFRGFLLNGGLAEVKQALFEDSRQFNADEGGW